MKSLVYLLLPFVFIACEAQQKTKKNKSKTKYVTESFSEQSSTIKQDTMKFEITKSENEWQKKLTLEQYNVLREKGTERPFTGEYDQHFEKGYYTCAACENPLFTSETKFNSHCGWPSFDATIKGAVIYEKDNSYGMQRVEVMCAKCGGHLGHVFDDGPEKTTGMRYCTNSISIKFVPEK